MVSQDSKNVDQWFEQIKVKHRQDNREKVNHSSPTDDLLNQLKQTHQSQKKHQPDPCYRETVEEIRVAEQRKQQQQKQRITQAKQWLNNLSTESDEGFWFEQFAQSYSSRLEAAIDYLECLEDQ